jgi:hypothetical protein
LINVSFEKDVNRKYADFILIFGWFKTMSPPPRLTWFVSLGSKVGYEPQMRHQNKGIFSQNANLKWLLLAFEATRFGGALKSAAPNDL